MDALRGGAVLLVVVWHAFSIPYPTVPVGVEWVSNFLSVYRIPLLMFLSGLLLDQSLAKPTGQYVEGKLRRIAWPLVVWSAILVLIGWPEADPGNWWFWLGDGAHLWYLGILLACYAIGLLTKWVHPLVFLVVGLVAMQFVESDIAFVNNTLWFGLYFFAGAVMSRWLEWWLRRGPIIPILFLIAASAWGAYSATVNGYVPIAHWRPFLLSILGVVAVVWLATRLPRAPWLEWVGQRSIVFYVAHVPFIFLTVVLVAAALPDWLTYAAVLIVTGVGCTLLARYFNGTVLFEFPQVRRRRPETTEAAPTDAVATAAISGTTSRWRLRRRIPSELTRP